MKILIIDDDPGIVENLELTFRVSWPDTRVISTNSGKKGVNLVENQEPDLVILDLGLPDINGFEVLKLIRQFSSVPIMILTVRSEEGAVVKAIGSGADEYIVKPFRQMELLARINAIFKRTTVNLSTTLSLGPMIVDFTKQTIRSGQKQIKLTPVESNILFALLSNKGRHFSCSELADIVWGDDRCSPSQAIRVHIRHIRQKIEPDPSNPRYIITSTGTGYNIPEAI